MAKWDRQKEVWEEKQGLGRGDKGKSVSNEDGEKMRAKDKKNHVRQKWQTWKRGKCKDKFNIAMLERKVAEWSRKRHKEIKVYRVLGHRRDQSRLHGTDEDLI